MRQRNIILLVLFLLLMAVGVFAQDAMSETVSETMQITTAPVKTHRSQGDVMEIEGASATLVSSEHGIIVSFQTDGLEDSHVYSMWVAVVNNPEACEASPCNGADMFGNSDEVQSDVTWGDSILYDSADGRASFVAHLAVGDLPESWLGNGLTNPLGAHIHLVINDHGELIPEMASTMLNTYRGGCADEGLPPPFPETAKSDGEAGPNTCQMVQDAKITQ
jgi:hypothetical protein